MKAAPVMTSESPNIDYDHGSNRHTLEGPRHALAAVLTRLFVRSLLDVGCGRGTWLKAASDCGIQEIAGVDGVSIPPAELHFPSADFYVRDLSQPLDLGRRFDLVVCLEVAEHLEAGNAEQLVANLSRHSDTVLFSAACPGQPGQHHVNCQWPGYWQNAFNKLGYACNDWPRWAIWADERIEGWYRQNMFIACRDTSLASKEPRIKPVVHPEMVPHFEGRAKREAIVKFQERMVGGAMSIRWYLTMPLKALVAKGAGKLKRAASH